MGRWTRLSAGLVALASGLLVAVGLLGPSAAKPPLGPRGWAPGELPWSPGPALVTALLAAAYVLGAAGVALALRHPPARALPWVVPAALAALALLTGPFGSADHTNYAAYGRIAAQGGDPYLVPPDQWAHGTDPVVSRVEPPWTGTVSVYGPFATLLQMLCSMVGGPNLRQTVWVWQLLTVVAWLVVRWLLRRLTGDHPRVDVLWTANPLVLGVGVLGAHLDVVCAALAVAALAVAARSPVAAGVLAGLALSTKLPYGAAGLAVLVAWLVHERRRFPWLAGRLALAALVVTVPLHLWAGPHVFDQTLRARRSVSLATPWRLLVDHGGSVLGSRNVVFALALAAAVALGWVLWHATGALARATVTGTAVRCAFVVTTAYTVTAPYSLPWYDQLTWATLPALAASGLDLVLLARLLVMALAYVPGRVVGMTPAVERATLAFRRTVAPYAGLLLWAALTTAARRVSPRRSGPRRAAS